MRLHQKLDEARSGLIAAGFSSDEAAVDVSLYARAILGWDGARLLCERSGPVPDALEPRFSEWIARRTRREPSAYIVGTREFWGRDFRVTPDVLIPRPDTELILEDALPLLRESRAPRLADIGTGSGCLAISIACEITTCRIVASDVSEAALDVARGNAKTHGVEDRIEFVRTSYLDGVAGSFDAIVANPPYVNARDKPTLRADVGHEPDVALFGGADGLHNIRGVLDTAATALAAGGWLFMEFGYGQEDDVRALIDARAPALQFERIRHDLQGIARTVALRTSGARAPDAFTIDRNRR